MHTQYVDSNPCCSKVIGNVKVSDRQTDKQTDRQTDRQGKNNTPIIDLGGIKSKLLSNAG